MASTKQPKIFFLAPGWIIHSSFPLLGSVITNPSQPDIALFRPIPATISSNAQVSTPSSSPAPITPSSSGPAGLFSTFLSVFGLGDEPSFSLDRKHILSYSFLGERSVTLDLATSLGFSREAVAEGPVAQLFANNLGVYVVTGVKTISGARVRVASTKGKNWTVELGIEIAQGNQEGDDQGDVIFALEVAEIKLQEEGGVVLQDLETELGALQQRLDREFDSGTFKVAEGFDETTQEPCLVVTSSPTLVDPYTAGTAKVGGEHGIWY